LGSIYEPALVVRVRRDADEQRSLGDARVEGDVR
jgi:hypothetical protein